jgi:predicted nucleic acid-binding protein
MPLNGIALDNTVISSLQDARALERVLRMGSTWVVPLQVLDEARAWPAHGAEVVRILDALEAEGVVNYETPQPGTEGALFAALRRTRGLGESAAIAIAYQRKTIVATDDRRAKKSCESLNPPVRVLATEEILAIAVGDGTLPSQDAREIWGAMGIIDLDRQLVI